MNDHDSLLCETVARHFPEARVESDGIDLGFGDLRMSCWVDSVHDMGAHKSVSLFFLLEGGRLGTSPVFASVSGYGESADVAIVSGACNWTCTFGPVLRAGLAGEQQPEVQHVDVAVDGQPFRVFVDALDRAMSLDESDATDRLAAARARFAPEAWLASAVLESGLLPILAVDRPTVISVFVSDGAGERVVEVKVNGCDWPGMKAVFASVAREPEGAITMMRELAVVVPTGPAPSWTRATVLRTVRGLADRSTHRDAADWPGWTHHGGALAAPLSAEKLVSLEARVGALPADYRAFLVEVAELGAGPGYGLMSPIGDAQTAFARGTFSWEHETAPSGAPTGVLHLGHAGCGVMWLLVLSGSCAGEVWADARSSDGKVRRVAATFSAWYRDWLSAAVQNAMPWIQWDSGRCATASVFSKLIEALERDGVASDRLAEEISKAKPGAVAIAAIGDNYVRHQSRLNPCQGCIALVARFDLGADVFQPGSELRLDGMDVVVESKRSWLAKLTDKLRSRT